MRIVSLIITILILQFYTFSQYGEGSPQTIEEWQNKTLVVVQYQGFDQYNKAVMDIAKKRWYSDKIEYVDYADAKKKKRKEAIYLSVHDLILNTGSSTTEASPVISLSRMRFALSNHKSGWAYVNVHTDEDFRLEQRPEWKKTFKKNNATKIPYTFGFGLEILNHCSKERLSLLIETIFNTADQFEKGPFEAKKEKTLTQSYITKSSIRTAKAKTLLIVRSSVHRTKKNAHLLEAIKELYTGKLKIIDDESLGKFLEKNDSEYTYLHLAKEGSFNVYTLFDIESKKVLMAGRENTRPSDTDNSRFKRMIERLSLTINQ